MHDFNSTNKVSGVYWLKQPIDDLNIKITVKPRANTINLPKYEEFMNISTAADLDKIETDNIDEYTFKWQEKVFSKWEINNYSEVHNCVTETQLDHHNTLNSTECKPQKIFTYIHEDCYLPIPINLRSTQYEKDNFYLSCFKNLNIRGRFNGAIGGTGSIRQLYCSEETVIEPSSWISMHIVYDDSTYTDDSQLLLKQEFILLSLYYNTVDNYLILSPDANNLLHNPYIISMEGNSSNFEYGVEIIFEELESDEELVSLLNKLYTKWEKKHKQLVQFVPTQTGKDKYYVNIEIISAKHFDMDNIYIEYDVKVPEDMSCEGTLHGRTHVSKSAYDSDRFWMYGHNIELDIEADECKVSSLELYLEAISTDWWGRHRTEGYCYLPLPLTPGHNDQVLTCSRPDEIDRVEANTRRFFVGGCHLIKDLEVLSKPQSQNANFTYTTTGSIHIRCGIIKQTNPGVVAPGVTASVSTSSALLRGAEQVLKEYSHARARLEAATKDFDSGYN